jgi:hypothetical protein
MWHQSSHYFTSLLGPDIRSFAGGSSYHLDESYGGGAMLLTPFDNEPNTDMKYLQSRVASLEGLVCELLTKNQLLRSDSLRTNAEALEEPFGSRA